MTLTADSFEGGHLASVMRACMHKGIDGADGAHDDAPLDAFEALFGWRPPAELAECAALAASYRKHFHDIPDVWMLNLRPVDKKPINVAKVALDSGFLVAALAGLEHFGDDPSGDSCFVTTVANNGARAEVFVFDHETGLLNGARFGSVANFIGCHFYDDEDGASKRAADAWDDRWDKAWKKRAGDDNNPQKRFARIQWLLDFGRGEPGYGFAERLERAAPFATWLDEKARLSAEPRLACYWMLAHWFLGNEAACREAVAAARTCKGRVAPELADLVAALLDQPGKAKLGGLTPAQLGALRDAVKKNVDAAQLDPQAAEALTSARRSSSPTLSAAEIDERLAAGADGWALLAEIKDDVAAHDRILRALAAKDDDVKSLVDGYLRERTKAAYNTWPYDAKRWDPRLSHVVAAAFRSGLPFDADSKKAFGGITNTLAIADDDNAMAAFDAAVAELAGNDDRLEYVVHGLIESKHPRAPDILERAARRFFDTLEHAKAAQQRKEDDGTINALGMNSSFLIEALHALLRRRDDARAAPLAALTLERCSDALRVFGTSVGHAVRVLVERADQRAAPFALRYLAVVQPFAKQGEHIGDHVIVNLAECALAIAKLGDEQARAALRAAFDDARAFPGIDLDMKAGALPGLLWLAKDDAALLGWLERLLGNRLGSMRIYACLRAVEELKLEVARAWVRPHLYRRRTALSFDTGAWLLQQTARDALAALGEPRAPAFDATDEFANRVPLDELPLAVDHPERHRVGHVLRRIGKEERLRDRRVLERVGPVLFDLYRYSGDEHSPLNVDDAIDGVRAVLFQGPEAGVLLGELCALPHLDPLDRTMLTTWQRYTGQEAVARGWLETASRDDVIAELAAPRAGFRGLCDVIAALGLARWPDDDAVRAAAVAAFQRRLGELAQYDHWVDYDVAFFRLGHVIAHWAAGRAALDASRAHDSGYKLGEQWDTAIALAEQDVGALELPLGTALRGPPHGRELAVTLTIAVENSGVRWTSAVAGCTLHDMLVDGKYQVSGLIACASPADAEERARRELRAAALLGHRVGPPPKARRTKTSSSTPKQAKQTAPKKAAKKATKTTKTTKTTKKTPTKKKTKKATTKKKVT